MKKIGFIGNFQKEIIGGQITKTRELFNSMNERYEDIATLDVSNIKKNVSLFIVKAFNLFRKCDDIVVILASPGYFKLLPIIVAFNILFKRNIYEFVIGGVRYEYLDKKKIRVRLEKNVKKIYVESRHMVENYNKRGLFNAEYLPNFKSVKILKMNEVKSCYEDEIHLCTFSRIDKYKGIDTAVEIVRKVNTVNDKIYLDIIGPISEEYKEAFTELEKKFGKNIVYRGKIENSKATDILKNYDMLICPTRWKAEGFPGSFIDAMSSGLIVLATNMENFKDIIIDGYNGYLIDEKCQEAYVDKICYLYNHKDELYQMKKNALYEVEKYRPEVALQKFWEELEG